jgi:PST family polysaccharide transporter
MLSVRENTPNVASEPLEAGHLKVGLMARSIRSAGIVLLSQGGRLTLQFVAMVAMARLVMPNEFGVFGVATAITGFGLLFKDGLAVGTVQRESLTQAQCSGLFWFNIVVGTMLTLVTCLAAPLVASFYRQDVLAPLLVAMAVNYLFSYASSQHVAVLKRQMRFGTLAIIDQIAMLLSVIIGIVLALNGCGVWSLAAVQIGLSVFVAIGAWLACDWRPSWYQPNCGLRALLHYGKDVAVSDATTYTMKNVDNLLIGWACGAAALGFYDRAYTLTMIPLAQILTPLGSLGLTALSRLQKDRERYRDYAVNIIAISCGIGMPISIFLGVGAHDLIGCVLGRRWLDSVPIMQALAPGAVADAFIMGISNIMLSSGKTKEFLIYRLSTTSLAILAFFVGVFWGPIGVAVAVSLSRIVAVFIVLWLHLADAQAPVRFEHIRKAASAPFVAAVTAGLIVVLCQKIIAAAGNQIVSLLISTTGYGVLYLAIWAMLPQGARTIRQIVELALNGKGAKEARSAAAEPGETTAQELASAQ